MPPTRCQIGKQVVESDGDDVLILRFNGDITPDEVRGLVRMDRELWRRNGYSLILIDGTAGGTFGAGARQAMFAEMELHPGYLGSTAMYGMPGALALVMKLVLRAVAILAKDRYDDEMQLFSTETEARAFLDKRRPLRRQQAAARAVAAKAPQAGG